jgi:hypothetical protein
VQCSMKHLPPVYRLKRGRRLRSGGVENLPFLKLKSVRLEGAGHRRSLRFRWPFHQLFLVKGSAGFQRFLCA